MLHCYGKINYSSLTNSKNIFNQVSHLSKLYSRTSIEISSLPANLVQNKLAQQIKLETKYSKTILLRLNFIEVKIIQRLSR